MDVFQVVVSGSTVAGQQPHYHCAVVKMLTSHQASFDSEKDKSYLMAESQGSHLLTTFVGSHYWLANMKVFSSYLVSPDTSLVVVGHHITASWGERIDFLLDFCCGGIQPQLFGFFFFFLIGLDQLSKSFSVDRLPITLYLGQREKILVGAFLVCTHLCFCVVCLFSFKSGAY